MTGDTTHVIALWIRGPSVDDVRAAVEHELSGEAGTAVKVYPSIVDDDDAVDVLVDAASDEAARHLREILVQLVEEMDGAVLAGTWVFPRTGQSNVIERES